MARPVEGLVLSERMKLEKWDPEGDSYVIFQRPTRLEAEAISALQAKSEYIWNTEEKGQVRQRDNVPIAVLEREMVLRTLVECNVPGPEKEDGSVGDLIFQPGKSCRAPSKPLTAKIEKAFLDEWFALPDELAEEIIGLLKEFHPPFDWRNRNRGED